MNKIDFNKPTLEREHNVVREGGEGIQKIWRFDNGYGASVVRFSIPQFFIDEKIGSYGINEGKWELAVIKFTSESELRFELDYSTKITSDVIGYLDEEQVVEILKKIRRLKKQ